MEIQPPVNGLFRGGSFRQQPIGTTPACNNIRPNDTEANRKRVAQRPGVTEACESELSDGRPVLRMVSINTTYIKPE